MIEGSPKQSNQPQQLQAPVQAPQAPEESESIEKSVEQTAEAILSPEAMEKIMEKVVDINTPGTPIHGIDGFFTSHDSGLAGERGRRIIKDTLRDGLIARTDYENIYTPRRAEGWVKHIGEKVLTGSIYFNIVGRDISSVREQAWLGDLNIIFDLADFAEVYPQGGDDGELVKNQIAGRARHKKVFAIQLGERGRESVAQRDPNMSNLKDIKVDKKWGFHTVGRISPRLFRGLVFYMPLATQEVNDGELQRREANLTQAVSLMVEAYKEKPGFLLPIYDPDGNLLWPKQMSYEEVKKLMAEREAKKAEEPKSEV